MKLEGKLDLLPHELAQAEKGETTGVKGSLKK